MERRAERGPALDLRGGRPPPTSARYADATGAPPCQALLATLGALRRHACVRGALDGILAATLGREAQGYARLSPAQLAGRWRAGRDSLEGRALAAFLWQVARRPESALRELEDEITVTCSPRRLLSNEQRSLDPADGLGRHFGQSSSRSKPAPRPETALSPLRTEGSPPFTASGGFHAA